LGINVVVISLSSTSISDTNSTSSISSSLERYPKLVSIDEAEVKDWSDISIGTEVVSRSTVNAEESHDCGVGGTSTGTGHGGVLGMEVEMEVEVEAAVIKVSVAVGVDRGVDVARFQWGLGRKL
jgi:hypothetical protein